MQTRDDASCIRPWHEPRLILIASSYTKYDTYAVNQLRPNIELLRYQRYNDGTFVLEAVNEPLSSKRKSATVTPASNEGGDGYTLDYHRDKTTEPLWAAFLELRDRVVALDGVEERVNQKSQITYRTTKSFAACAFRKQNILCQFKGGDTVDDPEGRVKDIRSYQWGYPWAFDLTQPADVDYAFRFFKDAYEHEQ